MTTATYMTAEAKANRMDAAVGSEALAHIRTRFGGKVAADLAYRMTPAGRWRHSIFNPYNDYQRHLYGLFLKLAGFSYSDIRDTLYPLLEDVSIDRKESYLDDLLHSEIVGFPWEDGTLTMLPHQ